MGHAPGVVLPRSMGNDGVDLVPAQGLIGRNVETLTDGMRVTQQSKETNRENHGDVSSSKVSYHRRARPPVSLPASVQPWCNLHRKEAKSDHRYEMVARL